jgi:hypothetical protein
MLETKEETVAGSSEFTGERARAVGTMTREDAQCKGFDLGRVRAREGTPGSTESQVEQTLARG